MKRTPRPLLIALGSLFAVPGPSLAVDGVLEINHTCAAETGCFGGDTAAYPVTISAGGSYRLTGNLIVPNENTHGILVTEPSVTIDLNGFEIVRSGCEGVTSDCTPASGTGHGVYASGSSFRGLVVKNGSITGMGSDGVRTGRNAEVSNVRVRWNREIGINALEGSVISGNTAHGNGLGIRAEESTIVNNAVHENAGSGIVASGSISGNTVHGNVSSGIFVINTLQAVISDNVVVDNGSGGVLQGGIRATTGTIVTGNTAVGNDGFGINVTTGSTVSGNTVNANSGDGILVDQDNRVANNSCFGNGSAGIHATGSDNRIDGNTVTDNTGPGFDVDSGGNLIVRNSASGNGMNYAAVAGGNTVGEVLDTTGVGGTITETTSAWGNFSF